MKLGLYSISLAGGFYDGPSLSLLEIVRRVREWGYEGVEVSAKRPHGSPLDLDERRRRELVSVARQEGVELPVVAAYTDFSSPIEEHRENELLMAREVVRLAADLGAPIVRVFAAWAGITRREGRWTYDQVRYNVGPVQQYYDRFPGVTQLERWTFVRDCLAETARVAEAHGVTLALQNHEPIVHGHEEVLEFVEEVGSLALKVSLDCPIMKDQSEEAIRRAVRETGNLMVHTHFGGEYDEGPAGPAGVPAPRKLSKAGRLANYPAFIRAIKERGYDGYLAYELCHPCLIGHRYFGLDEALNQVQRASRYLRHLIETA
ncbi:MAG: sugar phosphate isomerase/epimerase family protein [Chloroflexota bacterium]